MPSILPSSRRARARIVTTALAFATIAGCDSNGGGIAANVGISLVSPVTLVAGSFVDVLVDVTCFGTEDASLEWIDDNLETVAAPLVDGGVVVPGLGSGDIACPEGDEPDVGSGSVTLRLYAADDAILGLHRLGLRAFAAGDNDIAQLDLNVTAPGDAGFSLSAPPQVVSAADANIPVSVVRAGYAGPVALSWQVLELVYGTRADGLGITTVDPIPDAAATGAVPIASGPVSTILSGIPIVLVRARGGTTNRAVLVRLLPNANPPAAPTGFSATPAVTSIGLSWNASAAVLTWKLEREAAANVWEVIAADLPGATISYNDTGRTPDTPYDYRLSATSVNGTGPFATLSTRTLPTPPPPGPTGWYQIGPAVMTGSEVEPQPSMLIDALGRPVVAYREVASSSLGRIIVKRYNAGGFWGQMGSGQLNNGLYNAFTPSLAIDAAGVLYAAWSEYTGVSQRVYASRFPLTGGIWESVVPGNQPLDVLGAAASRPAIIVLPSGVPVVAWIQGGTIQVRTLAGGQWVEPAGGSGFTATTAYDLRLIADGATPVIAWTEGVGATNAIKLARGTPSGGGFTFTQVGGQASLPLPAGKPSFILFNPVVDLGVDYLVYAEGNTEFTVRSRRFNGGAWEDFGTGIVPFTGPQEILSIATPPNQLVVAFSVRAVSLNGSVFGASYASQNGWTFLTDILNPGRAEAWFGLSVAMASDRSPVVAGGVVVSEKYELRVRQYVQP